MRGSRQDDFLIQYPLILVAPGFLPHATLVHPCTSAFSRSTQKAGTKEKDSLTAAHGIDVLRVLTTQVTNFIHGLKDNSINFDQTTANLFINLSG